MSVRVQGLEKTHRGANAPALRGVSLAVAAGECAAILGRSGAGKSTLLRCLVGLDPFDRGRIEIGDVVVDAAEIGDRPAGWQAALGRLRGRIGLVFQSFELFPHRTVLRNCTLAPRMVRGTARALAEARARALLAELGLADKAAAFPDQLSGGQKQRVAIARALAMQPDVLLYDEPTSALDPSLRSEVRTTLQRIGGTGMTQLVVTHDVTFAREVADSVFILHAGEIVQSGRAEDVLASPKHEATRLLLARE